MKIEEKSTYLVCNIFKSHAAGVKGGSLFGVAYPESNVVEAEELSDLGLQQKSELTDRGMYLLSQWVFRSLPSYVVVFWI